MADETLTKKVTDLTESTEPADDDLFIAGASGTASLRKIKWSDIWTKITSSILEKLVVNNLVTTAAGYLLDARAGKTLNDKYDELNTKIGQIYTCDANFVNPNGQWTTGASLTLPAGVYIVIRRGHSMDHTKSIKLGENWEVGKYASGNDAVEYTKILSSETELTIVNFIYGNTDITNGIIAVKLK